MRRSRAAGMQPALGSSESYLACRPPPRSASPARPWTGAAGQSGGRPRTPLPAAVAGPPTPRPRRATFGAPPLRLASTPRSRHWGRRAGAARRPPPPAGRASLRAPPRPRSGRGPAAWTAAMTSPRGDGPRQRTAAA
eukprot:366454-Chlamydomonas_euryale.AAC.7